MTPSILDADLFSIYSDCYKSEFGVRPRHTPTTVEILDYLRSYDHRIDTLRAQWAAEAEHYDHLEALEREHYDYLDRMGLLDDYTTADWLSASAVKDRHP